MINISVQISRKHLVISLVMVLVFVALLDATGMVSASRILNAPSVTQPVVSYQGMIKSNGTPYSGSGHFKFAVVDTPTGDSTNSWSNDGTVVGEPAAAVVLSVESGLFNVLLGDTSLDGMDQELDETVFEVEPTYLRVWFSEDGVTFQALEPNQRFSHTPYALRAKVAETGPPETDPVFSASAAGGIQSSDIDAWDLAYSWGDHADAGYLSASEGVKQLVQEFVVAPGQFVSAGEVVSYLDGYVENMTGSGDVVNLGMDYPFNEDETWYTSASTLSENKFVMAYSDGGFGYLGTAMVGEVSGTTITYGAEHPFNPAVTNHISAAALSSTKFVVAYADNGDSDYGKAIVGEVSGTTITYGSEVQFKMAETAYIAVEALSDSKFVIAFHNDDTYLGEAVIGDVSGTTITFGSLYTFNNDPSWFTDVAALTDSKFLVSYTDLGNGSVGTVVVGDVSGNVIEFGSEYPYTTSAIWGTAIAPLNDHQAVVAYTPDSGDHGAARVMTVTGLVVYFGPAYVFHSDNTDRISAIKLSEDIIVISYIRHPGGVVAGFVSGTDIRFGSVYELYDVFGYDNSAIRLTDTKFVIAYHWSDRGYVGVAVTGEVPPIGQIVGIARESRPSGESIQVIVEGVSDVHTGLTPSELYYRDTSGNLTTEATYWPIGLAISPTELLLDLDLYMK